jgi:hypothetical protein
LKCGTKDDPGGAPGWGDAPATSGIHIKCMLIFLIMYTLSNFLKKKNQKVLAKEAKHHKIH